MFLAVKRHIIDYFVCTNSSVSTVESTTFPYQRNFHFLFPFTFGFEISIWTAQPRLERDVKCNLQCLKCMTFPTWDFVTVNQAADTEGRESGEKWNFHLLCYAISALFNQQHNITSLHSKKQNWSSQNSLFHSHDEKNTNPTRSRRESRRRGRWEIIIKNIVKTSRKPFRCCLFRVSHGDDPQHRTKHERKEMIFLC